MIGGEFRGRKLVALDLATVRPTSDRVREAIFDVLFSLGGVDGLRVADLFCGTGAMGIEALSRGATSVTFVDRDPASIGIVRQNLVAVGLDRAEADGEATLVRAEVESWSTSTAARFDLIFCDPPYAYTAWTGMLAGLPGDLVIVESGTVIDEVEGWNVVKTKRYGGTIVTVVQPDRVSQKGAL